MKDIVVKLLALIALLARWRATGALSSSPSRLTSAGEDDEHRVSWSGLPTVLLISGMDTASDLWHAADQKGPTVYDDIQKTTRACVDDRPGAPYLDQNLQPQRSGARTDQPQNGVNDLVVLLKAAQISGPDVLVAHSFSGMIARVFAGENRRSQRHRVR